MDQQSAIQKLRDWLVANQWADCLTVRCDHVTEDREELPLFLGPKRPGQGRGSRIAEVDILVCNKGTQNVELIIEVDPNPNPKKLMGVFMAALLADNYTPSNSYSAYSIKGTLVIFLTVLDAKRGSQKPKQFELIERAVRQKLDLKHFGIRDVRLCFGASEEEAIATCQRTIQSYLGGNSP